VGQDLLRLIETVDPIFLVLILGVLTLLGAKMAAPYPRLRSWGLRLAATVFVAYLAYVWIASRGLNLGQLVQVALRALVAAGLVLAPLWLVSPILLFIYSRLRLALATFLLYLGYVWVTTGGFSADDWPALAAQGGIAAALALLVAWILQPLTDFLSASLGKDKTPAGRSGKGDVCGSVVLVPSAGQVPSRLHEETVELLDLHKAHLRQEAERAAAEKHRRRQRARMKAELGYATHEHLIGTTFPRGLFEQFVGRYLGDDQEPEDVEEYAHELETIIYKHVQSPQPAIVQPLDMHDLTQWFLDEQQHIEDVEPDQRRRKTMLAGLTRKYTQLASEIFDEGSR
jgi:hypothetical protein